MLPIILYNSKSRQKEPFTPLTTGHVKLYVCGMTVYDFCHIGHARVMIAFDVLTRALRKMGYQVTYVRNITDIDDKIIKRANENHQSTQALTQTYIEALDQDCAALNILPPTYAPKATAYVTEMISFIEKLIHNGLAYVAPNGDVCFAVNRFPAYGQLSGQDLEKLRAGSRVAVGEDKLDPLDFVLWKKSKPGEPTWPSPWGEGRPGWHIECSAMSSKLLGDHFDIHGGGHDLLFPHHENELAQSQGACNTAFVNIWMHCGFVQVDHEKMSKSLGNFFTIRDVLKNYSAEVLRYFLTTSHYRSPINYSTEALDQSKQSLDRLYFTLRDLDLTKAQVPHEEDYTKRFLAALADDLNTPEAFAVIFELAREINRLKNTDKKQAESYGKLLVELSKIFGICQQHPEQYFRQQINTTEISWIENLIAERELARAEKNWEKADNLREELLAKSIILDDTPQGVKWRKQENSHVK